jgi:hypothetical protein
MIDELATAIWEEVQTFQSPAYLYFENEGRHEWIDLHPDNDETNVPENVGELACERLVRAVLRRLREPTPEMAMAAISVEFASPNSALHRDLVERKKQDFRAMIDAALGEKA